MPDSSIQERLEYLRGEIRAERISMGELVELQELAQHIDASDVELLEWAGVEEGSQNADSVPTTSDIAWHSDRESVESWCAHCGTRIFFDGETWWHNDDIPEDTACYDGNRGPEPQYKDGVPIDCYRSGVFVVWPREQNDGSVQ